MLELFNVKQVHSSKIVAGPFHSKKEAKLARDELDPDVASMKNEEKSSHYKFVVTKGKDHRDYGIKHISQKRKEQDKPKKKKNK